MVITCGCRGRIARGNVSIRRRSGFAWCKVVILEDRSINRIGTTFPECLADRCRFECCSADGHIFFDKILPWHLFPHLLYNFVASICPCSCKGPKHTNIKRLEEWYAEGGKR